MKIQPQEEITGTFFEKKERNKIVNVKVIDNVKSKHTLDYILKSGVAGGIAGIVAKTLVSPFDRVKILFQTSNPKFTTFQNDNVFFALYKALNKIVIDDGVKGLFRGNSITVLRIFPYASIKFITYEQVRAVVIRNSDDTTQFKKFIVGSISGVLALLFTYPLDIIRVRMAYHTNENNDVLSNTINGKKSDSSILSILKKISNENNAFQIKNTKKKKPSKFFLPNLIIITNFYKGFTASLLGIIPYAGTSFYTYELMRDLLGSNSFKKHTTKNSNDELKSSSLLVCGSVAGFFSVTISYPFEVIRRKMQINNVFNAFDNLTIKKTFIMIYNSNGIKGFFSGLGIGYLKIIPMISCSFFVYEEIKKLFKINDFK